TSIGCTSGPRPSSRARLTPGNDDVDRARVELVTRLAAFLVRREAHGERPAVHVLRTRYLRTSGILLHGAAITAERVLLRTGGGDRDVVGGERIPVRQQDVHLA